MPILTNPRHERFAQELAAGKSASEAFQLAGYKANDGNCIRLKGNERVSERVAELLGKAAKKTEITVERITNMFIEDRELARNLKQLGPAVAATAHLGKLHQVYVEKTQSNANVTIDEPVDRPPRETHDEWIRRRNIEIGMGTSTRPTNGRDHG